MILHDLDTRKACELRRGGVEELGLEVLDSSAILARLLREAGGELVEAVLPSLVSAVKLTKVVYTNAGRVLPVGGKDTRCAYRLEFSHLVGRTVTRGA